MRIAGQRHDGVLAVHLGGAQYVLLDVTRRVASSPMDELALDKLGPWTDTDNSLARRESVRRTLDSSRLDLGGPGSGFFGHSGRPGERGGSAKSQAAAGDGRGGGPVESISGMLTNREADRLAKAATFGRAIEARDEALDIINKDPHNFDVEKVKAILGHEPASALKDALDNAPDTHLHLTEVVAKTMSKLGGTFEDGIKAAYEKPGITAAMGPIKSERRILEKATRDYTAPAIPGAVQQVKDVVRATIAIDTPDQLKAVKAEMEKLTLARPPKDQMQGGPDGYRQILYNPIMPNGRVAEIQLHIKDLLKVKEEGGGHAFYDRIRSLAGSNKSTKAEEKRLNATMNKIYSVPISRSAAWSAFLAAPHK
jgi:hypothetical protein